jgi:putative heme-binding domain-containing protein
MKTFFLVPFCFLSALWTSGWSTAVAQQQLERELLHVPLSQLAEESTKAGNALRGAILFHSSSVGCAQCHRVDENKQNTIGPNLASWNKDAVKPTAESIVDSILRPSATIAKQYASTRILTTEGKVVSGVITSRDDLSLTLRFGPKPEDQSTIAIDDIEREAASDLSLMPSGMVQQLDNRGQFLDLVAYIQAIVDGGPNRAAALMPTADQLKAKLPPYESRINHAGLISAWNKKSLERGRKIYAGLCVNCHGTRDSAGSLPTALRFGEGKFKQGSDPHSIYNTLTHGSGLMLPQKWMVPQQKYDVIHFLREEFLKGGDAYSKVDAAYLASLPKGDTNGPPPTVNEPWINMDYGNVMSHTIEFGKDGSNIAQKAIAVRLDPGIGGVAKGRVWMAFEHDTMRWAAGWHGKGFIDWRGIQFDGAHGVHPRAVGEIDFVNPTNPGWANPETGRFDDENRVLGRDGKRYGPLPNAWAQFHGIGRSSNDLSIHYSVDRVPISERPFFLEIGDSHLLYGRALSMGSVGRNLRMLVATIPGKMDRSEFSGESIMIEYAGQDGKSQRLRATVHSKDALPRWKIDGERLCLDIPANDKPAKLVVAIERGGKDPLQVSHSPEIRNQLEQELSKDALEAFGSLANIPASPVQEDRSLATTSKVWFEGNGWAVDELVMPAMNRWNARTRVTGLAFYPGQDAMAVCTWDGDIWRLDGLDSMGANHPTLQWTRIASGLFQPLGILVLEDSIMVTCRDQLMKLRDLNRDGQMDDYACFNNDHQVTEHFHEFAMGLQRDSQGNFYYAKSARHALKAVVPHHGTLLRVSADGAKTDILATGFRAANGVCLNPDGTFVVTDQEGHWNPKNRINWVEPGKFYGNMFGYHAIEDSANSAMEPPLCWITNSFDRSPAELLWADSPSWGNLNKSLLNFSYGYGRIYVVPFETVAGVKQGGMCALPIPDLPTGIVRGKFSPRDGQLYVGGMFAWASSRQDQEGGVYRIRRTGQPVHLPLALNSKRASPPVSSTPTLEIGFSDPLDAASVRELDRYSVQVWDLKRTEKYGSDHINERTLSVTGAELQPDGKTIVLAIPSLEPTWCMSIDVNLKSRDGVEVKRTIHNTIHKIK